MKPIYKSLALAAMMLQVSVALKAETYDGTTTTDTALPEDVLDSLRVELVAPNISGTRDLIKSGECTVSDNSLSIELKTGGWIKGGVYRLQVIATFGTQTEVIYALDVTVPRYDALASDPQEYEDTVTVVSTVGGGGAGGGADATVYALDGDGNAKITKPLTVRGSVQEGSPYSGVIKLSVVVLTPEQKDEVVKVTGTAYDYCDINNNITNGVNVTIYADEECTQKVGSTVKTEYANLEVETLKGDFFNLQDGENISAGTYYARIERGTLGTNSHAEGDGTTASGDNSHAEGNGTIASGGVSHAEGYSTTASGEDSHAEGNGTIASGDYSHAEGYSTTASGDNSHAEGNGTIASGGVSHAEGYSTTASGDYSHAEGENTTASSECSHAEGDGTTASGECSHAEGYSTTASGYNSHAEGDGTTASGECSHAEGYSTTASGYNSHAEGNGTIASGEDSHAEGNGTIASQDNQHVCGQYNVKDTDNSFQFIVGNGADDKNRHNAFAVTKSGELALFEADGTPVILDAATLKALIASVANA